MSNRGAIITNPRGKSRTVAETAHHIPLFWLAFLAPEDIENSGSEGRYEIPRQTAIDRATQRLPLFVEALEEFENVQECCELLIAELNACDSETIGIDVAELIPTLEEPYGLDVSVAITAIESNSVDFSVTVPAKEVANPFTGEAVSVPDQEFEGLAEVLLAVTLIDAADLDSEDPEEFASLIVGHRWE